MDDYLQGLIIGWS